MASINKKLKGGSRPELFFSSEQERFFNYSLLNTMHGRDALRCNSAQSTWAFSHLIQLSKKITSE